MHQMAAGLTDYLIAQEIAAEAMRDYHIYYIEILIGKILNYTTLFLLALIHKNLFETLLFMLVFFSLRSKTGGFHANTSLCCYLCTYIIFFMTSCIITPFFLKNPHVLLFVSLLSVGIIYLYAPVNHPNLNLDSSELLYCRRGARRLALIVLFCILLLLFMNIFPVYLSYAVAGMGLDAGLILLSKILRQEVKNDGLEEKDSADSCESCRKQNCIK